MPIISVIVPCFNQGQYLSETLDSVLVQTFVDWECVIINDGSTDNTESVAKYYCEKDNRFKYLYQINQGVSVARNEGIKLSCGKYVLPLDGDDKIEPTYIDQAIGYFEHHDNVKLVYCHAAFFGDKIGPWVLPDYKYEELLWENCIFCSAIYKRADYDATQGYNPNMKLGFEDWDFWLSFLHKNDIVHRLDDTLFYYRIRGKSRNSFAVMGSDELAIQIYNNHREKYLLYANRLLLFKMEALSWKEEYELVKKQFDSCHNSLAYHIGKCILKPFSWLKFR